MPKYVLKILIEMETRDDIEARQKASALVKDSLAQVSGIGGLVLHSKDDNKSIRMNPDGTFEGQWNKGGKGR